ncbi:toprim domain-containing protein [Arcicella sp. LKC2W]|uniref:toprim domain-containing protein n=1 Tax=Arcicella sp. LKC2W TaxID=2984198 RepID=UPI002B20592E|nr:toprim domain-containing protein [Arcicella sp. LKC2W]MEA5458953.1 toprim domain-containing protein [Arcicella sp. LKC2W]
MKIQDLKKYPITDYLQNLGLEPVKSVGKELVYYSPKTQEKTPSFFVNPSKNVFFDYSSNEKGDVIRLVQYLEGLDFISACNHLEKFGQDFIKTITENSFSFCGNEVINHNNTITIETVKPLQANSLIEYCQNRKIPFHIAFKFLHEIRYNNNGKQYYSLGFKNDKGGFELRNQYFKGCTTPKAITTFEVPNSKSVYLFEGFFDFLSALAFFGTTKPLNTVIVLNSLSLLPQAKERLNKADSLHTFLDRDSQGVKAVEKLKMEGVNLVDRSKIYDKFKDFNEFLSKKT